MKQIEVSIMGQSYLLGCPDGGEDRLREAVSKVDREMCAIRDSGKLKARERIAVLSALNLAYQLTERPAAPAPGQPGVPKPAANRDAEADFDGDAYQPAPEHIDHLIQRMDQALGMDGHLI